jgi:four helix bundle protein
LKTEPRNTFNFEGLLVYQKALNYIDFVYSLVEKFPKSEVFGLASQFRNAANSIALNIGEGSAGTTNEFKNFIRISYRSINECVVCTTISLKRNYITQKENDQSGELLPELTRMLSGLRNSLMLKTTAPTQKK